MVIGMTGNRSTGRPSSIARIRSHPFIDTPRAEFLQQCPLAREFRPWINRT
jgi:hypothetical protein